MPAARSTTVAAAKKAPARRAPRRTTSKTPVLDALNEAVAKATHLDAAADAPAIAAARALALKIDLADEYFKALEKEAAKCNRRPPSPDNVSLPTFLKYCDALGLTPAGRGKLTQKPEGKGGKLGRLQSVPKPA